MNNNSIDKKRVEQCFKKSIETYNQNALIQDCICNDTIALLTKTCGSVFSKVFEIGAGTGLCTKKILKNCTVKDIILNDLVTEMKPVLQTICETFPSLSISYQMGDAETISYPTNCNLIISTSSIQWFTQHQTFLEKSHQSLATGGILALSSFGPGNITEIAQISGKKLQYPTIENWQRMLSEHFEILHLSEKSYTMHFDKPSDILNHMKHTGVNGIESARWTKKDMLDFTEAYKQFYTEKGYSLTYQPIYILCRKKNL